MKMKKLLAGMSAAAFAAAMFAMPVYADETAETEETAEETAAETEGDGAVADIQPDENGVYGQAGIVWMIQDQWDHRKDIGDDYVPTDELEVTELSVTHKDVNITGNGQYTVEMSGYYPDKAEAVGFNVGYLGVECNLNFEDNEMLKMEIDECTIDGVTYTFEKGMVENKKGELEPVQELEDPENTDGGQQMIKIKNAYGSNLAAEPEMDAKTWITTDPITITFTISGLATDKIEGYENEVIEKVYGNGSIENDPPEEEETAEETAEDAEEGVIDEAPAEGGETADAADADDADKTTGTAPSTATTTTEEQSSSNTGVIVGIVAAVVVVGCTVFFLTKKK